MVTPDIFTMRRMDVLPPPIPTRVLPVTFPREEPARLVESVAWLENRLWLTAQPRYSPTNDFAPRLWAFDPEGNRIERVQGVLENYNPNAIHPFGRELWLAVDGGAGAFHAATFVVDGFNAQQGLTSTRLVGFSEADGRLLALGIAGVVFGLDARGTNWARLGNPAPGVSDRSLDPWRFFAGSGSWIAAGSSNRLHARHIHAPEWQDFSSLLQRGGRRLQPANLRCITGDGAGGFWIGTDAGLDFLHPESGRIESHRASMAPGISGAVPPSPSIWHKPSAAAYSQARERVVAAIRTRMLERARAARESGPGAADPITPSSRIPGPVTAILKDKALLWIAAQDGPSSFKSRVLIYHPDSRRWVGSFQVELPVRCLTVQGERIYAGFDATWMPNGTPLGAFDRSTVIRIPAVRWSSERPSPADVSRWLSGLSLRERAVHAFFSGQPAQVPAILKAQTNAPGAEELFLLAFAHDAVGLDNPELYQRHLRRLHELHPDSVFTEATRGMLAPAPTESRTAPPGSRPSPALVLQRRDLNNDGKISRIEFRLWMGERLRFSDFDRNGDSFIDASELPALLDRTNSDGE